MSPEQYISLAVNILDSFGATNAIIAVLGVTVAFVFVDRAFGRK